MKPEKIELELQKIEKKLTDLEVRKKELLTAKKAAEDEQKLRLINARNITIAELAEMLEKNVKEKNIYDDETPSKD